MPAKSSKPAKGSAMSAALSQARPMLVAIGGPRAWDDTKDHWRNKLARLVRINPRRVRAILSGTEKVSLTADEYLSIEAQFRARVADLDRRIEEDLQALAGSHGDAPDCPSGEGGAPNPRADRTRQILARPGQRPDGEGAVMREEMIKRSCGQSDGGSAGMVVDETVATTGPHDAVRAFTWRREADKREGV